MLPLLLLSTMKPSRQLNIVFCSQYTFPDLSTHRFTTFKAVAAKLYENKIYSELNVIFQKVYLIAYILYHINFYTCRIRSVISRHKCVLVNDIAGQGL